MQNKNGKTTTNKNKEKKMKSQIRIPISFDLDLVKPNKVVSSSNKIVVLKIDEREQSVMGWMMVAYLNGEALENVLSFKNGKHGCADIINLKKQQTNLVQGSIQAFLCVSYKARNKIPKVKVFISNNEMVEA